MRTVASLLIVACLGCASAGGRPLGMGMGSGNCEDSCRAAYDRCNDDSRRKEPDDGTCAGDLQACLARCADTGGRQKQQVVYGTSGRGIPLSLIQWIFSLFK